MKVALYLRMSTDKQENSIESQQTYLTRFAKHHQMNIVNTYVDEGISGRQARKRPGFMQMIEDSEKKLFDAVLIYDSSRFARNLEESITYKSLLKRNGVDLISATEPTVDDDTTLITDALLGAMNEMYSRKLSKAVKRGMEFKARQGYFQTRPPYGYQKTKQSEILVFSEQEAKIVVLIFQWFTTTTPTYMGIARALNEMGLYTRNKNPWLARDIKRILMNQAYVGYIRWGSENNVFPGKQPSIIDQNTFAKAQQIILNKPVHRVRDPSSYSHWLSGMFYCSHCGRSLGFNPHPRSPAFRCTGNIQGICSHANRISVKTAEALIKQILKDVFPNVKSIACSQLKHSEFSEQRLLETSLCELNKKLTRSKTAYIEGIDSLEEYRKNKTELQSQIQKIHKQLSAIGAVGAIQDCAVSNNTSFIDLFESAQYTTTQKHNALKKIIRKMIYDQSENKIIVNLQD